MVELMEEMNGDWWVKMGESRWWLSSGGSGSGGTGGGGGVGYAA